MRSRPCCRADVDVGAIHCTTGSAWVEDRFGIASVIYRGIYGYVRAHTYLVFSSAHGNDVMAIWKV